MRNCRNILILLAGLILKESTPAAVIVWTNTAGGQWNTARNWDPNQVPSTNDVAAITNNGNYKVTLNTSPVLDGFVLGGASGTQTLAMAFETITLGGPGRIRPHGRLELSGGLLGAAQVDVEGSVVWFEGTIGSNAVMNVVTGANVMIGTGANYVRTLAGRMTNSGTVVYTAPGPFGLAGTLHNAAEGVFDIQWNSAVYMSGPEALFVNEGTIRKSAGVATSGLEVPLVHSGTIEVQTGTLVLRQDSLLNDGCRFVGTGPAILDGKTTNTLSGTLYSENLLLQDTTLTGAGTLSGNITWGAGSLGPDAKLLVATNSELYIGGGANHARTLEGSLTNLGAIVYTSPGPFVVAGILHNAAGGLFDVRWSSTVYKISPQASFINEGLLRKQEGVLSDIEVPFLNRGRVSIPAGRLNFAGNFDQPSGDILLLGGSLRCAMPLDLAGGRLLGWGTVEGDLSNTGATISPTNSGGVITIAGRYVQHLGGNFEVTLAGTQPGTNHSRLSIAGTAELNGTITAQMLPPYLPSPGETYAVMTFASRKGDFARRNGFLLLGHNRRLETVYSATSLSLMAMEAPDPSGVSLQIGKEGQAALISWPLEFGSGTLYACTNLAEANWVIVPTVNNSFLDSPMLPWRWFRLTIP